jgi:hypothetical protein
MKVTAGLGLAVFFLFLGIFGIVESLTFHYWESMALPLTVSSIVTILASIETGKELRRRNGKETPVEEKPGTESTGGAEMRRFGLVLAWVLCLTAGIYLFGFRIGVPVFTLAYLKWRGRSWLTAFIVAAAALAVLYGVFELGLKAPLFKGIIFGGR